jgi:hypothetical protein
MQVYFQILLLTVCLKVFINFQFFMQKKSTIYFVLIFLILLNLTSPAYAYLDPGTGSMIIQLVIAGVLGAIFTLKTWWRQILGTIKGIFSRGN